MVVVVVVVVVAVVVGFRGSRGGVVCVGVLGVRGPGSNGGWSGGANTKRPARAPERPQATRSPAHVTGMHPRPPPASPVKAECVSMCGDRPTPDSYSFTVNWSKRMATWRGEGSHSLINK